MGIRPHPDGSKRRAGPSRAGIAGALFSATQQRVLGLLYGQPGRSFFASELIALAGGGSGAVQRELRRLSESGLATVTRVGNQKHYRANESAPIFEELRGIVLKTLGPADVLRTALEPLSSELLAAWLFGSVAKGRDSAGSDIDVLLVAAEGSDLSLERVYGALSPAEKRLGRQISPVLYTATEFKHRKRASFLRKVLAGERILLIGSGDAE